MKFAKQLQKNYVPEWRDKYVDYKRLKKLLKKIVIEHREFNEQQSVQEIFTPNSQRTLKEIPGEENPPAPPPPDLGPRSITVTCSPFPVDITVTGTLRTRAQTICTSAYALEGRFIGKPQEENFFKVLQEMLNESTIFATRQFIECEVRAELLAKSAAHKADDHRNDALELYKLMRFLQQFLQLNSEAVRKIVKKHDKLVNWAAGPAVNSNVKAVYKDLSESIDNMLNSMVEYWWQKIDKKKNKKSAVLKMLNDQVSMSTITTPLDQWDTFGLGTNIGICLPLLIVIVSLVVEADAAATDQPVWEVAWPVFRCSGLFLLHAMLWGADLRVLDTSRINYPLMLDLKHSTRLPFNSLLRLVSILVVVYLVTVASFLASLGGFDNVLPPFSTIPPRLILLLFVLLIVAFMLNPIKKIYGPTRLFIFKTLSRLFRAPLLSVDFAAFFIADQLCSHTRALNDFMTSLCFLFSGVFTDDVGGHGTVPEHECFDKDLAITLFSGLLPYWVRFFQCLRRYRDSGDKFPHLANATKYLSSMLVVVSAVFNGSGPYWIVAAIASTSFSFCWDLKMDWGLLQKGEYFPLRKQLLFPKKFYYWAVLSNLALRVGWVVTLSPAIITIIRKDLLVFALGCLEVCRRCQWNALRLENEQLNNCGHFRAVKPLMQITIGSAPKTPAAAKEKDTPHEKTSLDAMREVAPASPKPVSVVTYDIAGPKEVLGNRERLQSPGQEMLYQMFGSKANQPRNSTLCAVPEAASEAADVSDVNGPSSIPVASAQSVAVANNGTGRGAVGVSDVDIEMTVLDTNASEPSSVIAPCSRQARNVGNVGSVGNAGNVVRDLPGPLSPNWKAVATTTSVHEVMAEPATIEHMRPTTASFRAHDGVFTVFGTDLFDGDQIARIDGAGAAVSAAPRFTMDV